MRCLDNTAREKNIQIVVIASQQYNNNSNYNNCNKKLGEVSSVVAGWADYQIKLRVDMDSFSLITHLRVERG